MSLPDRLGRLSQVERLGVGGFASVWLYRDDELQSDVAVKALADNWAQRLDIRDRFLQEARILRRADSDFVVRVYDVGEVDGTPYFVMTYADRGTVANLLEREHALSLDRTVALVSQAGAGLSVLHAHGSIHRDIKPANLLLRSDGAGVRVMVADLGVAKAMLNASGLTHVVGTPAYMAPEQATGGGVDERADVYALAAVTYQLLTGELAHAGTIPELAHLEPPTPPSKLADVPAEVDDVVLRGLARDRDERWPDVHSFVTALQATAPDRSRTLLVPAPNQPRLAAPGSAPAGSRGLWVMLCLAVFVVCFVGALVVTQQLT
ncbi:MAG TPA: serine/threonine-protein kinase [Nocardioides sp.]|nr:serine/threonine-protein kinase [Nocardioides sp.]